MTEWAIDSHVHFHKCFDEGLFFDSCFRNLLKIKSDNINNAILCFTEGKYENSFNYLIAKEKIKSTLQKNIEYQVRALENGDSIEIQLKEAGKRIIIFPGFQVVTAENLEVLALLVSERIPDKLSAEDTISKVLEMNGIPVLPWGFGKWYGSRGKKINQLIENFKSKIFLGDNGGRSNLLPYPEQFRLAETNGIRILPGSDPLPFPSEAKRPLSYGFTLNFMLNNIEASRCFKDAILDSSMNVRSFGKLTSPFTFIKTQLAMQFKKNKIR